MKLSKKQKDWLKKNGFEYDSFWCSYCKNVGGKVNYRIDYTLTMRADVNNYYQGTYISLLDEELFEQMKEALKLKKEWEEQNND